MEAVAAEDCLHDYRRPGPSHTDLAAIAVAAFLSALRRLSAMNQPPLRLVPLSSHRTFDLRGCDRNTVTVDQHLFTRDRHAVHADQVVGFFAGTNAVVEQLLDGGVVGQFDMVCETAAIVVDKENFHRIVFLGWGREMVTAAGRHRATRVLRLPRRENRDPATREE